MLKLRSIPIATDKGNSPAAKAVIACGLPSSDIREIGGGRPVTGSPSRSVTVAYTSTRFTLEVNCP